MFILIITIPFGVQAVKLGIYALWPFGRVLVPSPNRHAVIGPRPIGREIVSANDLRDVPAGAAVVADTKTAS